VPVVGARGGSLGVPAICTGLLLAAARHQGGQKLYDEVIRFQATERLTVKSDSPLEYWLGCLGTYALGYPLAVLVVAACWRRIVRRSGDGALLLGCLAARGLVGLGGLASP